MRRLFSTFARGWPGVGLLLMRIVAGSSLILEGAQKLQGGPTIESILLGLIAIADGALLFVGLWTPIAGSAVIVITAWEIVVVRREHPYPDILLAAMGAAIALIGPGALSLDAWLYGWKRIDV